LAAWLGGVAELMLDTVVPGPAVVRRLDDEHDNLVQAVEWAAARDDTSHVLLAAALARSWRQRAQLAAARRVLRRALPQDAVGSAPDGSAPHGSAHDRHLAEALGQEAVLAFMQGDMARGVALGERVLGIGRRLDDRILLIRACGVPRQGDSSGLGGCDRAGSLVWWFTRSR
jgi:hypothetical protein